MRRHLIRASAVWLAGSAALMPVAAFSDPDMQSTAQPSGLFQPPQSTMLLTRTLRRPLPGGKQVVTRRSYEVSILPDGEGFRIDGKLVDVAVEAPENLGALAEIERKRPDKGMFPMRLDAGGMLLPGADPQAGATTQEAIALASQQVDSMKLAAFDMLQARAFVGQFQKRQGLSEWPVDLFRPAPGKRRETRTIPLPNGARGQVTVDTEAQVAAQTGLLSSFTRTVITDLGDDVRATYETWTLAERP
ncbi:MAG: hypothetical protein H6917_06425 [Novosphingobium sp.]|nr:hypothetical protein [Novosphingobium sp.]MCP5402005.1 hypothetical protein [Novosphingobium sp.]